MCRIKNRQKKLGVLGLDADSDVTKRVVAGETQENGNA